MMGGTPPQDEPRCPVNVGIMAIEPGVAKDQREVRRFQDVELYGLVLFTGQEHVDGRGLMSDGPQEMTVQGVGWHGKWQRNLVDTQLDDELNEGGKGVRAPCKQKPNVKQRSWAESWAQLTRTPLSTAEPSLLLGNRR